MASGSAGRANAGSKGFDFGSDDILCTYDDFANKDSSNGNHSDVIGTDSSKDFHKTRMARSSAYAASSYNQPEDSFNSDMITVVERTMKKHNDNLMRFLEGISSRLSQLELHCYNLDKSIGEMRSDLGRDHGEADSKLKTLEKHIQEVHRSVQILRDKQELADTQKELAKLQLVHKDSSSPSHHSQSEEKGSPPSSDMKKPENMSEIHNNQLAIDLPHKILPPQQPAPVPQPPQAPPHNVSQQQSYYMAPAQLPNPHQGQYMTSDPQYQTPQAPQSVQTQAPQGQQFPQYQQQWPMQQPQMRPSPPSVYPTYPPPSQPTNSSPSETQPMQMSYAAVPQPISSSADTMPYGYGASRIPQQPGPKANYGPQLGDGYAPAGPHSALPPGSAYVMYDSEGGRTAHHPPPHFPQGAYPPPNLSLQTPQRAATTNMLPRNPTNSHYARNHPYSELVDKLVSMGFRGDQVISVIQRMDESGQPVDFNAVLDRLSNSSGGSQRGGWSG